MVVSEEGAGTGGLVEHFGRGSVARFSSQSWRGPGAKLERGSLEDRTFGDKKLRGHLHNECLG